MQSSLLVKEYYTRPTGRVRCLSC